MRGIGTSWIVKRHDRSSVRLAEQKNRELADIKVKYMERQRQADAYKRRVDVIDQLRNGHPVRSICSP